MTEIPTSPEPPDTLYDDFPVSTGRCVHCCRFTAHRESWRNDEQGWTIGYCKRCASWVETEMIGWEGDFRD